MRLTPTERDRLLMFMAAELAPARRARGRPDQGPGHGVPHRIRGRGARRGAAPGPG
ncbi:urease subunit gamma [Streptomyces sp. DSM 116496]|uniref:urease subunit gamma n=1 Tax=Streptomyces stoeckheimensis TaxID=3344656 RepID=UPI0038B2704D